jgi:uncharacterized protein (DUF427 family)
MKPRISVRGFFVLKACVKGMRQVGGFAAPAQALGHAARQQTARSIRFIPERVTMSGVPTNGGESRDATQQRGAARNGAAADPAQQDVSCAHTVSISRNPHRVRVIHQGVTFADTQAALTLAEAGLADVVYFPRGDVNMARLERSTHSSRCPHKGDASYFHLRTEDGIVENAAWSYEAPIDGAGEIKGYLAFYASRVDRIDQTS